MAQWRVWAPYTAPSRKLRLHGVQSKTDFGIGGDILVEGDARRVDGATVYGHTTPKSPTPSYLRDHHNDDTRG